MQNELSFGVEFTRTQMENILSNTSVVRIAVFGTYSYMGESGWVMTAVGQGMSVENALIGGSQNPCIQPCPTS